MASETLRADLARGAWAVGDIECQRSFLTLPHGKLLRLIRQRGREGSIVGLSQHRLQAGGLSQGQSTPTPAGGRQGAPMAPLSSTLSLNLLEQVWHSRGSPTTLGATRQRYAAEAILVCRRTAEQALHALAAIVARMDRILNRTTPRITQGTEGVAALGCHVVRRRSPTSGPRHIDMFPRQAGQRSSRRRIQSCTKRRAPGPPGACGRQSPATVAGWVHASRPTNASQALRALQRFINTRLRRSLTSRRKGRVFGWQQYPN
jgi:RNA-directed DNA polymerase